MAFRRGKSLTSSISYWITAIIGISSMIMIVIGLAVNMQNKHIGDSIETQLQEQITVQELERLSQSIVSSYRGFIAYGRDDFLNEVYADRENLITDLGQIRITLANRGADDRLKADEVSQILTLWNNLAEWMDMGIAYKKRDQQEEIVALSQTKTTPAVDSINKRFNNLNKLQEAHVMDLVGRNKEMSGWLLLVPAGIILMCGVMGYYLIYYLRKAVISPVLYMSSAVSKIAAGQYVDVSPSSRSDELGDLQRGILRMSEELKRRALDLEAFNRELINQRDLLEAQNEEISAQQEEQHATLLKLTARERELELISSYQEKLAGYLDMNEFLHQSVPALLQALGIDAGALVLRRGGVGEELVYSAGYPASYLTSGPIELFGPALRVFAEKQPIARIRELTGAEQGIYSVYAQAYDLYYPLLDNDQLVYGFLLLTQYGGQGLSEHSIRANRGLIKQFSLALQAQVLNEERLKQSALLEHLNEELQNEKQLLKEQRDLIRQINESIHEGMVLLDSEGRVLFANRRFDSFFGTKLAQGVSLDDLCGKLSEAAPEGAACIERNVRQMMQGEAESLQERFEWLRSQDSRYFELYVNALEGSATAQQGYLLVFRDRTEEEKVDGMKNEFISIVSHELRTPLSSVLGFIEILLHRNVTQEKRQRYLETIHKEATRLSNLINDFLDLQRMQAGKQVYQPVPCDLPELVRNVAEQWQGKNGHTISVAAPQEPLLVSADRDRITQVLHNLISNAVKYSPQSDRVDVICSREGDEIRVDIRDYGLGIPEEAKDKLFSKFYRVDNSDRRQIGGTGLGLVIVKEIVEAHKGRLSFESELGAGSTFTFYLQKHTHHDLSGRVVIVEDDENLAHLMAVAFEKLLLPTVLLTSAEDAVYSMNLSAAPPVLCIVDIQLNGVKSGWDFISELLKHSVHRDTPVIVSTVLEPPNHFYETSKERYLKKPFTIGRLLELAQAMISESQTAASFVFPVQDRQLLTDSLQNNGIKVKDIKVKTDFIEVDVDKHGQE